MFELRILYWENAGYEVLQFRTASDLPSGREWSEWKDVPKVSGTSEYAITRVSAETAHANS